MASSTCARLWAAPPAMPTPVRLTPGTLRRHSIVAMLQRPPASAYSMEKGLPKRRPLSSTLPAIRPKLMPPPSHSSESISTQLESPGFTPGIPVRGIRLSR